MNEGTKEALIAAGVVAAGVGAAVFLTRRAEASSPLSMLNPTEQQYMRANFTGGIGWVRVVYNGQQWDVSPEYIAPVGIGEAEQLAAQNECMLPTPGLVDAIWKAADLKLQPLPRAHDGTPATMASQAVFDDQYARIQAQIAGRPYKLLAGTHKDVVVDPVTGKVGLYGWHRLDGSIWQPLFLQHAKAWIDYSQGLRLCRRVS